MKKTEKMAEMANAIEEGALLEHLEEVGHVRIDHLTDYQVENLELLIETLEEYYNIPARETHDARGWLLENEHYWENLTDEQRQERL